MVRGKSGSATLVPSGSATVSGSLEPPARGLTERSRKAPVHRHDWALDTIEQALTDAGASIRDIVVSRTYIVDIEECEAVADALRERFVDVRSAMTMVEVSRLMAPKYLVEIEVEAVVSSHGE